MNALNYEVLRNTEKLYYKDQYLAGASTQVTRVHSDGIELQSTVAYPEGGGQEADVGTIELPIGTVRFVWVKKLYGSPIRWKVSRAENWAASLFTACTLMTCICWTKSPLACRPASLSILNGANG